ncbi:MAG: MerR family transcriptional regulator [Actinomycetota bacterium]
MSETHRDLSRAVYVISVAAELAGVHPQTLRIYERKGLVSPARTDGGSRRYSDEDISHLQRIQELTDDGLNLAGVKRVLELETELAELQAEIERLRAEGERVRAEGRAAVADAERQHRAELVPVSQSLTLYRRPRR